MQYYLANSLPTLFLDKELDIHFSDLLAAFKMNLSKRELEEVNCLRQLIDLENLRRYLQKESIDPRGNLNEKQIEEALLNKVALPDFVFDFLARYDNVEAQLEHFGFLFAHFFCNAKERDSFVSRYMKMEREIRLLLAVYRAKKLGVDTQVVLQYEDFGDPFVAFLLAQKDQAQLEFPFEYTDLKEALALENESAMALYLAVHKYKFQKIEQEIETLPFSLDYLLGYMMQLIALEDYTSLKSEAGKRVIDQIA